MPTRWRRASASHTIIPAFAMHADGTPQMAFGDGRPITEPGRPHPMARCVLLLRGQNPQAVADALPWRVTGGKGCGREPGFDLPWSLALRAGTK